jgi:hypothetical protein
MARTPIAPPPTRYGATPARQAELFVQPKFRAHTPPPPTRFGAVPAGHAGYMIQPKARATVPPPPTRYGAVPAGHAGYMIQPKARTTVPPPPTRYGAGQQAGQTAPPASHPPGARHGFKAVQTKAITTLSERNDAQPPAPPRIIQRRPFDKDVLPRDTAVSFSPATEHAAGAWHNIRLVLDHGMSITDLVDWSASHRKIMNAALPHRYPFALMRNEVLAAMNEPNADAAIAALKTRLIEPMMAIGDVVYRQVLGVQQGPGNLEGMVSKIAVLIQKQHERLKDFFREFEIQKRAFDANILSSEDEPDLDGTARPVWHAATNLLGALNDYYPNLKDLGQHEGNNIAVLNRIHLNATTSPGGSVTLSPTSETMILDTNMTTPSRELPVDRADHDVGIGVHGPYKISKVKNQQTRGRLRALTLAPISHSALPFEKDVGKFPKSRHPKTGKLQYTNKRNVPRRRPTTPGGDLGGWRRDDDGKWAAD